VVDDRIVLELECLARHGALDLELAAPQLFRVRIECPARPVASDQLADALDYRRPHEIALAILAGPPRRLLETLADEIATRIRDDVGVPWVRVRLTKVHPSGLSGSASVEVVRAVPSADGAGRGRRRAPAPNAALVELHVPDFGPVKEFYGALGFRVEREDRSPDGDGYLVLALDGNLLAFWPGSSLVERHPYFRATEAKPGHRVEIVLMVEDLEAAHERASRLGAVVAPLVRRPWGARDFRAADPFGFYLRFSEPHDVRVPPRAGYPVDH